MADWRELGVVRGDDGRKRCGRCTSAPDYMAYHDDEWGRPVTDDTRLYEKICLEGFQFGSVVADHPPQAGGLRRAFAGFAPKAVADSGVLRTPSTRPAGADEDRRLPPEP